MSLDLLVELGKLLTDPAAFKPGLDHYSSANLHSHLFNFVLGEYTSEVFLDSDGVPVLLRVMLKLLDALGSNISLHDFLK